MGWCLQSHGSKCQWWRRRCHSWFVCLFDICFLRKANSVRALYEPMLQGLPEEVFIVACPHHSFPCAFPQMHHQYQHGSPAFAFQCGCLESPLPVGAWQWGFLTLTASFVPLPEGQCLCVNQESACPGDFLRGQQNTAEEISCYLQGHPRSKCA